MHSISLTIASSTASQTTRCSTSTIDAIPRSRPPHRSSSRLTSTMKTSLEEYSIIRPTSTIACRSSYEDKILRASPGVLTRSLGAARAGSLSVLQHASHATTLSLSLAILSQIPSLWMQLLWPSLCIIWPSEIKSMSSNSSTRSRKGATQVRSSVCRAGPPTKSRLRRSLLTTRLFRILETIRSYRSTSRPWT